MILPILLNKTKLLPLYVIRLGVKENQTDVVRPTGFPGYQILYCTDGSGVFSAEGREYKLGKGDAFFFRPDIPHEYHPLKEPWKTKWVTYTGSSAENIADYLGLGNTVAFSLGDMQEFDMLINSLSDIFLSEESDKEIKSSSILYRILIKVGEYQSREPQSGKMTQTEKFEKINPVIELMKNKYSEDLGLDTMSETIGVTPNHLCRLFNQVYNTTPLKYLTHLRINMAKYFLAGNSGMKIKEIAEATGFHDSSYFCAVFRKSEGITPEEYRRLNAL